MKTTISSDTEGSQQESVTNKNLLQLVVMGLRDYGLGVVIAAYMVWWSTHTMGDRLEAIQHSLTEHISATSYLMQQICINTARDESAVRLCLISGNLHEVAAAIGVK